MGQPISKSDFDAAVAPVLAQKQSPPVGFKAQCLESKVEGETASQLVFLGDGTLVGWVKLPVSPDPVAVRGTFRIDLATHDIITDAELSLSGENKNKGKATFRLDPSSGRIQPKAVKPGQEPEVSFLTGVEAAADFLPPAYR
jgi:hypothetical protein